MCLCGSRSKSLRGLGLDDPRLFLELLCDLVDFRFLRHLDVKHVLQRLPDLPLSGGIVLRPRQAGRDAQDGEGK